MEQPHAFNVNLETNAFSLEQTTSLDFDLLYEIASNPVVWEQHPEKDRWKRPVFSAFFHGAMENDLGCFTIRTSLQASWGPLLFPRCSRRGSAAWIYDVLNTGALALIRK